MEKKTIRITTREDSGDMDLMFPKQRPVTDTPVVPAGWWNTLEKMARRYCLHGKAGIVCGAGVECKRSRGMGETVLAALSRLGRGMGIMVCDRHCAKCKINPITFEQFYGRLINHHWKLYGSGGTGRSIFVVLNS